MGEGVEALVGGWLEWFALIQRICWRPGRLALLLCAVFCAALPDGLWAQSVPEESTEGAEIEPPTPSSGPETGEVELRLSLEEAVRLALEQNIQIRISRENDSISQRETIVARAVFDPFFNMGATYAKNRDPSVSAIEVGTQTVPGVASNPSENVSYSVGLNGIWLLGTQYNLQLSQSQIDQPAAASGGITFFNPITRTAASLDLRQPLLKGAGYDVNVADLRIAANSAEITREELERITIETIFSVEAAYWELLFAEQNLDATVRSLELALENLENTKKKHVVGTLAAIDVTTAESQRALRKVDAERGRLLRENSRDALLDLLNYSGEESLKERLDAGRGRGYDGIHVVCATEPSSGGAPYGREQALKLAFLHRPDYRQNALYLKNQEIRRTVARNDLLPSLDLLARWTQLGLEEDYGPSYREIEGGRFYDWLVGFEFSIPLSNRASRSRYRNARSEVRKIALDRKSLENQIVLDVDQALREIESLEQRVQDLRESVRYHEQLLQAERRKLEVGKSVAYTVSTIENDLVEQQTQALRANADLQTARARLHQVTGTTLERYRIVISE